MRLKTHNVFRKYDLVLRGNILSSENGAGKKALEICDDHPKVDGDDAVYCN
jgi:hypothetical protein